MTDKRPPMWIVAATKAFLLELGMRDVFPAGEEIAILETCGAPGPVWGVMAQFRFVHMLGKKMWSASPASPEAVGYEYESCGHVRG
jgi:hypothetical protein